MIRFAYLGAVVCICIASCSAYSTFDGAVRAVAFERCTRPAQRTRSHAVPLTMSDASPKRKVVVTGVGMVTPVGIGSDSVFQTLLDGNSGVIRLPSWADQLPSQIGALVPDFDPSAWMTAKEAKRQGRYTQFSFAATKIALEESGLNLDTVNKERVGVFVGSGIGGVEWFERACTAFQREGGGEAGLRFVSPFLIPALISNTATGSLAINYGFKGPNYGVVSACATGTHAISLALKYIRDNDADVIIAGGAEACMTPLCFSGFCALRAMTTTSNNDPKRASKPYDANRSGFVMSEGCGVLVLESEEHARQRGATILCELAGASATCDAHHITAPHPEGEGLARCMQLAIKDAGVMPEDIAYINAHGTSTILNDKFETMAIKKVFGEHSKKLKISSIKSMIGHSLGAAGGIEAAVCAKVFKEGFIPPTINYETPDPECDLDCTPNEKFKFDTIPKAVLSDNLGFGGHNAAVVFKRYDA